MSHTIKAAAILRQLVAELPRNLNSQREQRARAALMAAAQALEDYGTELAGKTAISQLYKKS